MECSICLEAMSINNIVLECGHKFCRACLDRNINNNCPLCRRSYGTFQTRIVNNIRNIQHNRICYFIIFDVIKYLFFMSAIYVVLTLFINHFELIKVRKIASLLIQNNNITFNNFNDASVDCLNNFNHNIQSFMTNIQIDCDNLNNQICQSIIIENNITSNICSNINDYCFDLLIKYNKFFENKQFIC